MSRQIKGLYEFGPFRIDLSRRLLLQGEDPIFITPKAFETLVALIETRDRVATKDELLSRIWPDTIVEEGGLTRNISVLRKALGESPGQHEYIVTVPGQGYRFVAEVKETPETSIPPTGPTLQQEYSESLAAPAELPQPAFSVPRRRLLVPTLGVVLLGLVLALVGYLWSKRSNPPPVVRSIAILPFKPLIMGERDEPLELGMADTLITRLSSLRRFVVRPITSVRKFSEDEVDPITAGKELRVDAVLDGTVQRDEQWIRLTVRLLRVADGAALWAGQYDEPAQDLFSLQDSISTRVAATLAQYLSSEEERRLTRRDTQNVEAYRLYSLGRYFWNKRTLDGLTRASGYFRQAIDEDPAYALAYAGLADALGVTGFYYLSPQEYLPKAKAAAEKALEIDDALSEGYATLGAVQFIFDHDWLSAEKSLRRAIELSPSTAIAHHLLGWYLVSLARTDEAFAEVKEALELDPLSMPINRDIGAIYYWTRRYDEAFEHFQRMLEIDPGFFQAHQWLGMTCEQKKDEVCALRELTKAAELSQQAPEVIAALGHAYATANRKDEARRLANQLKEASKHAYISPHELALIEVGLGNATAALGLLEAAVEERSTRLVWLQVDPRWDPLRSNPRFKALVAKVGFE